MCYPDIATQRAIAGILEALDRLIENNRRRIQVLEEMAKAIYREWFVRFRYPGHEADRLVESPLGPIPEGWSTAPLREVASVNCASRKPVDGERIKYLDISCLGNC